MNYFFRQHELCLQLRDTQNSEYLGELYLDVTLTPQSREERELVNNTKLDQQYYNMLKPLQISIFDLVK